MVWVYITFLDVTRLHRYPKELLKEGCGSLEAADRLGEKHSTPSGRYQARGEGYQNDYGRGIMSE